MTDNRIAGVLGMDLTLAQTLIELGMTHRSAPAPSHRKEILRDGEIVGTFNADECWEWLRDGCPAQTQEQTT